MPPVVIENPLQRGLPRDVGKAEIDDAARASRYETTSRQFPPPSTRNIAVKVINRDGNEVMQVYGTGGAA